MSMIVLTGNTNDKVFAATSQIQNTTAYNNGTNAVTISCGDAYVSRVEFLPDSFGVKYDHSFAILVTWSSGAIQEVVFGCADPSVNGANWVTSNGVTLTAQNADTSNPTSITVSRYNSTGTKGNTVSRVTLNNYYIANYGLAPSIFDPSQRDNTVGSYNNPACWYWRRAVTPSGTLSQVARNISWTKPTSGTPLYYVIMLWKGYSTSDIRNGELASVIVSSGLSNSVIDNSEWGSDQYGPGWHVKITVHPIYTGGPNPSFSSAQDSAKNYPSTGTGMGQSGIEDWAIWWKFANPPTIYNIKFYEQNKSTILVDSNNNPYDYYAPVGSVIDGPTEIKINGIDVSADYVLDGYYKKVGTGSWGTVVLTDLGTVTNSDLSFAQSLSLKTVNITLNANGGKIEGQNSVIKAWMPGSIQVLQDATPYSKTGYDVTFDGWWTAQTGGTRVDTNYTVPNSATTLWAHYIETPKLYDITYSSDGRTPSTVVQIPYNTSVTIDKDGGTGGTSSFTVSGHTTIESPSKEDFVFVGYDYNSTTHTFTANWVRYWDWDDESLIFLAYRRPVLNIGVKRASLQNPDQVVMIEKPDLCELKDKSGKDKNFVSQTSRVKYREEDRNDKVWSDGNIRCWESRLEYGNPEYPTWQTQTTTSTPLQTNVNSPFRTDLVEEDKTTRLSLDIAKEWQVQAKIFDALGYSSKFTHKEGTKQLNVSHGTSGRYYTESKYSNIALLIKYVTKLFVHNPFMDEVIKETRGDKKHRQGSNPPETDYWQIREHTQSSAENIDDFRRLSSQLHSILKDRSDAKSMNGFDPVEIEDYLIPTLKRALVDNEYLVYDYSQMEKLLAMLEEINSTHEKIEKEVSQFGLENTKYNNKYKELEVGNFDETKNYLQRILDLDGERHTTQSTSYTPEADTLTNRVRDTDFQNVELANFDDEKVKENPSSTEAVTTIDHISNYDISSLDLQRSLSDFVYMLSRMRTRQEGDEGPKGQFNDSTKDSYNQTTYMDNYENVKTTAFTNWTPTNTSSGKIDGTWSEEENPISEYDSSGITDYSIFTNTYKYENNGCRADCMGLCKSGCYSSCVGGCKTACGDSCFHRCTSTCVSQCSDTCASVCDRGCNYSCGTVCSKSCGTACSQACADQCTGSCGDTCSKGCAKTCTTVCDNGCNQNCGTACSKQCSTACNLGCAQSCGQECRGDCGGACSKQCGTQCNGTCSAVCASQCQGTCGDTCQGTCRGGCDNSCEGACKGDCVGSCNNLCDYGCQNDCSTGCLGGCTRNCAVSCTQSCSASCSRDCKAGCIDLCRTGCGESCSSECITECSSNCFNGCGVFCNSSCYNTCSQICTAACKGECTMSCQEDCENNCRSNCADSCSTNCANVCAGICSYRCTTQCGGKCIGLCMSKCTTTCIGDCRGSCAQGCDWSCTNSCSDECSGSCGGNCGNNCTQDCGHNCWSNCGAGCNQTCNSQCTTGCFNQCKNSCKNTAKI